MRRVDRILHKLNKIKRDMNINRFSYHILFFIKWTLKRLRSNIRSRYYSYKYTQSAPDPYKLIYINPQNIEYLLVPRFRQLLDRHGTYIISGNWDKRYSNDRIIWGNCDETDQQEPTLFKFENYVFYQSVRSHFKENIPWEDTEIYNKFLQKDLAGRYKTKEKALQRLNWIDELYESMKENGYKTQSQMKPSKPIFGPHELYEVRVNIGRNGGIIFEDGRHRVVVAKILGIEKIPVRVLVRHEKWQKIRSDIMGVDCLKNTNSDHGNYINHPDIEV